MPNLIREYPPAASAAMAYYFPQGITLKRKEGLVMAVDSVDFRVVKVISEKYNDCMHERTAVFDGRKMDTGETVILKLRFQHVSPFGSSLLFY
jgi:hypothetical protein